MENVIGLLVIAGVIAAAVFYRNKRKKAKSAGGELPRGPKPPTIER